MNTSGELTGFFEHMNGVRFYPPMPVSKPVPNKYSAENADLSILEIRQEIERLNKLLAMKLAEENAKVNGKTRKQMRAEIAAPFIESFGKQHMEVLASIAKKVDPPKKARKITAEICKYGCAGTKGARAEDYKITSLGKYVLEILQTRYPEQISNRKRGA